MNKKFISAIMAGAMAISALSVSVSAADPIKPNTQENADYGTKAQSYKIAAAVTAPEMKVTLPSTVVAVINPYGVNVKINEEAVAATDGIVSPIYTITNNSTELGITVKATTTATATTGITVIDDDTDTAVIGDATESGAFKSLSENKLAFAQVVAGVDTAAGAAPTALAAPATPAIFKPVADATTTPDAVKLFSLKPTTAADKDGEKGYFQIQGKVTRFVTKDTKEVEVTWTSTDKVNLVLVLDIVPAKVTTSAVAT